MERGEREGEGERRGRGRGRMSGGRGGEREGGKTGRLNEKKRHMATHLRLLGINLEFFTEGEVPDVFHVVPVPDDTVLHRVVDLQHGPQLTGLITNMKILYTRLYTHNTSYREYCSGMYTSSACLDDV